MLAGYAWFGYASHLAYEIHRRTQDATGVYYPLTYWQRYYLMWLLRAGAILMLRSLKELRE